MVRFGGTFEESVCEMVQCGGVWGNLEEMVCQMVQASMVWGNMEQNVMKWFNPVEFSEYFEGKIC